MTPLRLGSRGSQLALWQARTVAEGIRNVGGPPVEIIVIKTTGDRFTQTPLGEIGGKRSFVKEIEDALLTGEVDIAVHSAKDLPAELPDGLTLPAILPREDPRDVLVRPEAATPCAPEPAAILHAAGRMPRIGTGSVRRIAQLTPTFGAARWLPIRGNLDTRLRKLDEGAYDVLVLAAAGLRRLGFGHRVSAALPIDLCVPAPGQGAIAVETRADGKVATSWVARLNDASAMAAVRAERALVTALGGGCQIPIGALATVTGDALELKAVVASLDGRSLLRHDARGPVGEADQVGADAARALLDAGAGRILDDARRPDGPTAEPQT